MSDSFVSLRLRIFENHNTNDNYYCHEHWFWGQSHFFCRIMVVYVSQREVKTRPRRWVEIMWWGKFLCQWAGIPHPCVPRWFQHLCMWTVSTSVHIGFLNIEMHIQSFSSTTLISIWSSTFFCPFPSTSALSRAYVCLQELIMTILLLSIRPDFCRVNPP